MDTAELTKKKKDVDKAYDWEGIRIVWTYL